MFEALDLLLSSYIAVKLGNTILAMHPGIFLVKQFFVTLPVPFCFRLSSGI
jgi:hypothetical protein